MKIWAFIIILTIAVCSGVMYFILVQGVGISFNIAQPDQKANPSQPEPVERQPVIPPPTHDIIETTPPNKPDIQLSAPPNAPEPITPLPAASTSGLVLDLSSPSVLAEEDKEKNDSELSKFFKICGGFFKSKEEKNKDAQDELDKKNQKANDVNDQYKEYMQRQKERMRDYRYKKQ